MWITPLRAPETAAIVVGTVFLPAPFPRRARPRPLRGAARVDTLRAPCSLFSCLFYFRATQAPGASGGDGGGGRDAVAWLCAAATGDASCGVRAEDVVQAVSDAEAAAGGHQPARALHSGAYLVTDAEQRAAVREGVVAAEEVEAAGVTDGAAGRSSTVARLARSLTTALPTPPPFAVKLDCRIALLRTALAGMNGLLPKSKSELDPHRPLEVGMRVTRGPDWKWGDQVRLAFALAVFGAFFLFC